MPKHSIPRFVMPVVCIAAVAVFAIAACAIRFSARHEKDSQTVSAGNSKTQAPTLSNEQRGSIRASLDALPLAFEANQGQTDPRVKYTARGNGYSVFLTGNDAVFAMSSAKHPQSSRANSTRSQPRTNAEGHSASIDMRLVGGNSQPEIVAGNELPGIVNYYVGSDPKDWHTGVKQYSSVSYRDVYPGVNMVFHGAKRQLEFDFVVSPGADPKTIALGFKGARKLATNSSGNLVLTSSAGDVVLHKPVAYQEQDGKRKIVEAAFRVSGNKVGLNLGRYDRQRELVIDPSLSYATYLGGTAEDDGYAIAIDTSGDVFVTGQTKSTNFPTVTGASSTTNAGAFDVFVSKIAPDGTSLLYSTYIGGTADDSGNGIAVDDSGNAFVAGGTTSVDFPTQGGFQSTSGGGVDAFVLELASSGGSLIFSTYLGGSGTDVANGIAIDSTGEYVVGSTTSTNFPLQGAYQGTRNGASNGFVSKVNTSGTALAYSTYLGQGTGDVVTAVAVHANQAYVTGATNTPTFPTTTGAFQTTCGTAANCNGGLSDAFVTVFQSSGSTLAYSTFLGGEGADRGLAIAVDSSGNAYVTGGTQSSQFPLKTAVQGTFGGVEDAFVSELNSTGSALVYSTYLGGSLNDTGTGIVLDGNRNAYVTGQTDSTNFPTHSAPQTSLGGGNDAFVSEITASGASLAFSSYLGGALDENNSALGALSAIGAIAVDSSGANIYVAGTTVSSTFPATNGSVQTTYGGVTDVFVAKYATGSVPTDFTVSNGALSNTAGHAGVSATATITVGSTNGFNSAVQLQCSVSPSVTHGPICTFSSGSVTPPANGTTTSTLNVATTAASAMLLHSPNSRHSGFVYAMLLPIFGIAILGSCIQSSDSRCKKFLGFVVLGMTLSSVLLLPACAGGGGGGGGGGGTPNGSYTITVTGTSGASVVTGTPTLTLTLN